MLIYDMRHFQMKDKLYNVITLALTVEDVPQLNVNYQLCHHNLRTIQNLPSSTSLADVSK